MLLFPIMFRQNNLLFFVGAHSHFEGLADMGVLKFICLLG